MFNVLVRICKSWCRYLDIKESVNLNDNINQINIIQWNWCLPQVDVSCVFTIVSTRWCYKSFIKNVEFSLWNAVKIVAISSFIMKLNCVSLSCLLFHGVGIIWMQNGNVKHLGLILNSILNLLMCHFNIK